MEQNDVNAGNKNDTITTQIVRFYESISKYLSERRGFTVSGNKSSKNIENNIKIFISKNIDGIIIGYDNVKQDKEILVEILSGKAFKKHGNFFSDVVIDEKNNMAYRVYLLKDKISDLSEIDLSSSSVFLFNCLDGLEIEYNKHSIDKR